ncbi:MAG TPA: RNA polymerase sigma factor [Thermoanaerobaculia bacterium]|nr:RNA polymerase sigma factor [Thermoanaerobaculia bacterium]
MAEAVDESRLVAQAVEGDGEAFRALVDQHGRSVYRLAWRMTGNAGDAEDVVQETFMRAYRNLGRFDSRAAFPAWLHTIASRCALDLLRLRRRAASRLEEVRHVSESEQRPRQEAQYRSERFREEFERAMTELSPSERVAFVLRHFEGRSTEEIGRELRLGKSASKHAVFRAVRKLRRALAPFAEGLS